MIASLDRHLKEAGSSISIAKDREFVNSRKVIEGKARFLREQGYGKRPRASKTLTTMTKSCCGPKDSLVASLRSP